MKIGSNIRYVRTRKGLTHKQVAAHLGITQQAYGKIERNESGLTLDRLAQLARIFGLEAQQLLHLPAALLEAQMIFSGTTQPGPSATIARPGHYPTSAPAYASPQPTDDEKQPSYLWQIIHYQQREMEKLRQEKAHLGEIIQTMGQALATKSDVWRGPPAG